MSGLSAIDMAPAIALLAFDSLTVSRRTSSYNSAGVLVVAAPTTTVMPASVQPLGAAIGQSAGGRAGLAGTAGKNVDLSPQGQRVYGSIVAFTAGPLYPAASPSGLSDEVTWRGDLYDVVHSEQWDGQGYWRSILAKKEV